MTILNDSLPAIRGARITAELPRGEFLAGLFALGCASGVTSRVIQTVHEHGWADAAFRTFDISALVWIAGAAGIALVLQDRTIGLRSSDLAVGTAVVALVLLPIGPLSWLAVAALGLYTMISSDVSTTRRGAVILLAATVPMLWSRLLFHFFANAILRFDATLVGWLLRTHRSGDIVEFADGSGVLVILPACSSLANVSLAFLCWVTVSRLVNHKPSPSDALWCLMAAASVVAVNVTRISFMGLSQWHHATFHSPWGDAVSNVSEQILIVGFCLLGVRHELHERV